jgi:hypothetical protein
VFRLKCDLVLDVIVDFARGVPLPESTATLVESHIQGCRTCAARLQRERELSSGLKAVAGLTAAARPAPEMEQRLLEAYAVTHAQASRARTYSRVWRAAAAVLLIAAGLSTWSVWDVQPAGPANAARGPYDEFMPLPIASALPALESGVIVRIELPVAALPRYGVAIPDTARREVEADLLVGQDGQPRAIRLINFDRSAMASRSRP